MCKRAETSYTVVALTLIFVAPFTVLSMFLSRGCSLGGAGVPLNDQGTISVLQEVRDPVIEAEASKRWSIAMRPKKRRRKPYRLRAMFVASKAVQLSAAIRDHNALGQRMNGLQLPLAPESQRQASLGKA